MLKILLLTFWIATIPLAQGLELADLAPTKLQAGSNPCADLIQACTLYRDKTEKYIEKQQEIIDLQASQITSLEESRDNIFMHPLFWAAVGVAAGALIVSR